MSRPGSSPSSLALVLFVLLFGSAGRGGAEDPRPTPAAQQAEESPGAVIPGGQEKLLGEMLGADVPLVPGCVLSEGQVERRMVRATYKCAAGDVVFELHHPSDAPAAAATTDHFAVVLQSGSPPEGMSDRLVSRIRERESTFEWKWVGPRSRIGLSFTQIAILATAGVLAMAVLAWVLQKRLASSRTGRR